MPIQILTVASQLFIAAERRDVLLTKVAHNSIIIHKLTESLIENQRTSTLGFYQSKCHSDVNNLLCKSTNYLIYQVSGNVSKTYPDF